MYRLYGLRRRRAELNVFYRELLGGRRIRPPILEGVDVRGLWFAFGTVRVEVRADLGSSAAPILLHVEDPDALAQRCWDAGFTVRVRQDETGQAPVSVVDPFGRRIDLAPRVASTGQRLRAS